MKTLIGFSLFSIAGILIVDRFIKKERKEMEEQLKEEIDQ